MVQICYRQVVVQFVCVSKDQVSFCSKLLAYIITKTTAINNKTKTATENSLEQHHDPFHQIQQREQNLSFLSLLLPKKKQKNDLKTEK